MTRRRNALLGVAVVAAYLIAAITTAALRVDHVRPLYDGTGPPPAYRFVDPPRFFATGNVRPRGVSKTMGLGPDGSETASVATPDGQFVISLGRGAIAPRRGAKAVTVRITPLAPDDLPPVPAGLRPDGNAYRVEATYRPVDVAVTRFASSGSLLMEIPELGHDLFASTDASRWTTISWRALAPRQLTVTATLDAPGYYLAATNLPELGVPGGRSQRIRVVVAVTLPLAAAGLVATFIVFRRRRLTGR